MHKKGTQRKRRRNCLLLLRTMRNMDHLNNDESLKLGEQGSLLEENGSSNLETESVNHQYCSVEGPNGSLNSNSTGLLNSYENNLVDFCDKKQFSKIYDETAVSDSLCHCKASCKKEMQCSPYMKNRVSCREKCNSKLFTTNRFELYGNKTHDEYYEIVSDDEYCYRKINCCCCGKDGALYNDRRQLRRGKKTSRCSSSVPCISKFKTNSSFASKKINFLVIVFFVFVHPVYLFTFEAADISVATAMTTTEMYSEHGFLSEQNHSNLSNYSYNVSFYLPKALDMKLAKSPKPISLGYSDGAPSFAFNMSHLNGSVIKSTPVSFHTATYFSTCVGSASFPLGRQAFLTSLTLPAVKKVSLISSDEKSKVNNYFNILSHKGSPRRLWPRHAQSMSHFFLQNGYYEESMRIVNKRQNRELDDNDNQNSTSNEQLLSSYANTADVALNAKFSQGKLANSDSKITSEVNSITLKTNNLDSNEVGAGTRQNSNITWTSLPVNRGDRLQREREEDQKEEHVSPSQPTKRDGWQRPQKIKKRQQTQQQQRLEQQKLQQQQQQQRWRHQQRKSKLGSGPIAPPRPNVVEENPTLDVGPLVHITVAAGQTARLPCPHRPQYSNDSARLVLWYRNDTTRPFLSYDGREEQDTEGSREQHLLLQHYLHHHPGGILPGASLNNAAKTGGASNNGLNSRFLPEGGPWHNEVSSSERIILAGGGQTLALKYVQPGDQAEYRCTVHFRRSPASTHRMQLTVVDHIAGLRVLDSSGGAVGNTVGPFSEGHRLLLSCWASLDGELDRLEWLLNGEPLPSSWSSPRTSTAVTRLDLTLRASHDHSDLVCRLTTDTPHHHHAPSSAQHATSKENREHEQLESMPAVPVDGGYPRTMRNEVDVSSSSRENVAVNETSSAGAAPEHDQADLVNEAVDEDSGDLRDTRREQKESTVTDVSMLIHMYSVPVARLTVLESGSRAHTMSAGGGASVEVEEGGEITFKCVVRSRPPPYNITFMINGKVSSHTRGARDTLRLYPVGRRDAGLYTCLASNTEGDGHSNAILLRINHSPYCLSPSLKSIVVARNTSVTLRCGVEAQPQVTSYRWVHADPRASDTSSRLPWEHDAPSLGTGPTLTLVPAQEATHLVCYASNSQGHSQVPCVYSLTVVDTPAPPKDCTVTVESPTRIEVSCNQGLSDSSSDSSSSYYTYSSSQLNISTSESTALDASQTSTASESGTHSASGHQNDSHRNNSHASSSHLPGTSSGNNSNGPKHVSQNARGDSSDDDASRPAPGQLGFVRSFEVRPATRLEVWSSSGSLLVNMSSKTPVFSVRGLPPSSQLTLRLYSTNQQIVSQPLVLYARTQPWPSPRPREEPTDAEVAQETPQPPEMPFAMMWLAAGGAGALLVLLVLAGAAVTLLLLRRNKKKRGGRCEAGRRSSELDESGNGTDSIGGEEVVNMESTSRETVTLEVSEFWIRPAGLQQNQDHNQQQHQHQQNLQQQQKQEQQQLQQLQLKHEQQLQQQQHEQQQQQQLRLISYAPQQNVASRLGGSQVLSAHLPPLTVGPPPTTSVGSLTSITNTQGMPTILSIPITSNTSIIIPPVTTLMPNMTFPALPRVFSTVPCVENREE